METKDTFFSNKYNMNCEGKLIDLSTPRIMGILNVTPDSFFDGGHNNSISSALLQVEKMILDGATFIDVGGYSSRPNAKDVSIEDEINRTAPIIEAIKKQFPHVLISIDTFRSVVAKEAINSGACIVNDISAGKLDDKMFDFITEVSKPYIAMHMRGNPQNMQSKTSYKNVANEVVNELSEITRNLSIKGVNDVIIDPGFGFSKTLEQNYQLLNNLELLQVLERPILVGISRKSMIYNLLKTDSENAINGTTSINTIALLKGANILRVHDVKEASEITKIITAMKG
jgi:dihydropteroate synthase